MKEVWMHKGSGYLALVTPCYVRERRGCIGWYECVGLIFENQNGVLFVMPDTELFKSHFEVLGDL